METERVYMLHYLYLQNHVCAVILTKYLWNSTITWYITQSRVQYSTTTNWDNIHPVM